MLAPRGIFFTKKNRFTNGQLVDSHQDELDHIETGHSPFLRDPVLKGLAGHAILD